MVTETYEGGSICTSFSRGGLILVLSGTLMGLVFGQWTAVLIIGLVLILIAIIWNGVKLSIGSRYKSTSKSFGQLNQEEI